MPERVRGWAALVIAIVVIGVVPIALDRDSYPVSSYPMFSVRRPALSSVGTAVAVGEGVMALSPEQIAATDEVIQAAAIVRGAIDRGEADALCRDIAERVAGHGPEGGDAIEVVTESYDAVAWYDGDRRPLQRVVHARCPVP